MRWIALLLLLPALAFGQGNVVAGQGVKAGQGAFFGPAGVPPIPPPPITGTIAIKCGAAVGGGSIAGAQTCCLWPSSVVGASCGSGWSNAGVDIFYTVDGSPANEASQWYSCKTNTSGCISLPDPTATRQVTVNAVLVQTLNTTISGCSSSFPCYGVIYQDGMNNKANMVTNVASRSRPLLP